jgi:hypothetical protein
MRPVMIFLQICRRGQNESVDWGKSESKEEVSSQSADQADPKLQDSNFTPRSIDIQTGQQ